MTTNIGAEQIIGKTPVRHSGQEGRRPTYEKMKETLKQEMERQLPARVPQPRGRHHRLPQLDKEDLKHIIDIELAR